MTDSLYGRLKEYGDSDFYPFHMPGHKRNLEEEIMPDWYSTDITEIDRFDNLHQPLGILLQSQQKASQLYHSEETFFLINGGTCGILSALSAVSVRGSKVLIGRNSHMSVYHGALLNRYVLDYICPDIIEEFDIAAGISAAAVKEKIAAGDDIAAVVITSPTYEGVISDIEGIAEILHQQDIPLIVDQAHGAHFGFHPGFPESAVKQGADIVIHSVHKTLPAPTQTALLHVNGDLIDRTLLRCYLRIYQSSSPSYPLMAGMDTCMNIMENRGRQLLEELLAMRRHFQEQVKDCRHIRICEVNDDPSRVVISVKGASISGQLLADRLRNSYHLEMEMAEVSYAVAIFSIMDQEEGINRLARALCEIDRGLTGMPVKDIPYKKHLPRMVVPIGEAMRREKEERVLEEAVGRISGEFISLYPPGIPMAVPGERLDEQILETAADSLKVGLKIHGISPCGKVSILK